MARRKKRSLVGKIMIFSIVSLAIFGGYRLYQENADIVNKSVDEIKNFVNEISIVINETKSERD